ncbi:histidine kinase [Pseudocitrobacter cyperus]|uniref:Histidine kinase n=1 Tax=Pseudocitrobacter cyperus TaxID=3112843 RepID=A0ABV0HN17_9ENTR
MEWQVIDIVKTPQPDVFSVITQSGKIKTITTIESAWLIQKGDIISPTLNATYYINNNRSHTIKILSCICFSPEAWGASKRGGIR